MQLEQWDEIGELAYSGMREATAAWCEWQLGRDEITEVAKLATARNQEAATCLAHWYLDHDRMADAIELAHTTNSIMTQDVVVQALVAAGRGR